MGKRGPKPGERVPYGFADWNSPLAQREIWGAPKFYEWQEKILRYFSENLHVHAVMSTPNESGKTQVVVPILISPRMHVGSDDRLTNARGYRVARELQSRFKCFGTVVDPGKQMTMKIDHAGLDEYPLL